MDKAKLLLTLKSRNVGKFREWRLTVVGQCVEKQILDIKYRTVSCLCKAGAGKHEMPKLEKCAVVSTCRPTSGESWPVPIAKVKTLNRRLGLGFDLRFFDLRVSACRGPTKKILCYMSTKFGADSSSRFPFRSRTNRQTDANERPTPRRRLFSWRG